MDSESLFILVCVLAMVIPLLLLRLIGWALGIAELRKKADEILDQLKIANHRSRDL